MESAIWNDRCFKEQDRTLIKGRAAYQFVDSVGKTGSIWNRPGRSNAFMTALCGHLSPHSTDEGCGASPSLVRFDLQDQASSAPSAADSEKIPYCVGQRLEG